MLDLEVGQEINGVDVDAISASAPTEVVTETTPEANDTQLMFTMPSGKSASLKRKFTGANIRNCTRASGDDSSRFTWYVACELVEIEGKPIHYDEMLLMDGADVFLLLAIANKIMGKGAELVDTLLASI